MIINSFQILLRYYPKNTRGYIMKREMKLSRRFYIMVLIVIINKTSINEF